MPNSDPVRYLSIEEAIQLHIEIMERTGSEPQPLRSMNGLASALNRAPSAGHYAGKDLIGQAARLATGISRAQAFLEGNKRTAYAVSATFLKLNGLSFTGPAMGFAQLLDELADPSVTDDDADDRFESWLRDRVGPRR